MQQARLVAVGAIVLASLMWGTTGTAATFLPDAVSPIAVGASTMGVGGLLLFLTAPRLSARVLRDPFTRKWAVIGAIGVFVYPLAFYTGMDLAGVAIGNVVALGTGPVVTAIFERVVDGHRLTGRWMVSTALAVAGMVVLTLARHPDAEGGSGIVAGVLVGLLAGVAYALYTYASGRAIATGASSPGVMGAMFGCGALGLLPVLLATGAPLLAEPASVGIAAYLALGPTLIAYVLVGFALRTLRSSTVTTVALLEPVGATVLAVTVVGERLEPLAWGGIVAILVGIVVLVTARPPRIEATAP